jgi:hypothetical protein
LNFEKNKAGKLRQIGGSKSFSSHTKS